MKPARKGTQKSTKGTAAVGGKFKGFTEEEHGAMRERIQELRGDKADGEGAVLAKIAGMREPDRTMGKRLHGIIKESAPVLSPRLWYGMPPCDKNAHHRAPNECQPLDPPETITNEMSRVCTVNRPFSALIHDLGPGIQTCPGNVRELT